MPLINSNLITHSPDSVSTNIPLETLVVDGNDLAESFFPSGNERFIANNFSIWHESGNDFPIDNCNNFFELVKQVEGTSRRSEDIGGVSTYSMYGITPDFLNTYIDDQETLSSYQTKLGNGTLTDDDAKDIYCALWNALDVGSKPADVQLLYADAAVSHGTGAADRLYDQATQNRLPGESLSQSYRRHRIGAYMGQNWVAENNRKPATSEFAAMEAWLNRISKVEQVAGLEESSLNSTIDHMTLDRAEADQMLARGIWDPSVANLLKSHYPSGALTMPMLSLRLYGDDVIRVTNGESNLSDIQSRVGSKYGFAFNKLEVLNPSLHRLRVDNGQNQNFYRLLAPLTTTSVSSGDTWNSLAQKYNMSADDLRQLNHHINNGQLHSGNRIIVPDVTLQTGESKESVSAKYSSIPANQANLGITNNRLNSQSSQTDEVNLQNLRGICTTHVNGRNPAIDKVIQTLKFDFNFDGKPSARPNLSPWEEKIYEGLVALSHLTNDFSRIRSIQSRTLKD